MVMMMMMIMMNIAYYYRREVSHPQTFWAGIVMACITPHIIPLKTMSDSQSVNAIFIVEVVWLVFRPVCEIIGLIICPGEIALCDPIV